MKCRDEARLKLGTGDRGVKKTYGLLGLFDAGFDLLECRLEFIVDYIDLMFADDGDGRLSSELLRARPAQAPIPSHSVGTRDRATTMGGIGIKGVSIERSDHAVSRRRIFEMEIDGEGG